MTHVCVMTVSVAAANYLEILLDSTSLITGQNRNFHTEITCPVDSLWTGNYVGPWNSATCIVNFTDGGTMRDVTFWTKYGLPKDLYFVNSDLDTVSMIAVNIYCTEYPAKWNQCLFNEITTSILTTTPFPTIDPTTVFPTYLPSLLPTDNPSTMSPTNTPTSAMPTSPTMIPTSIPTIELTAEPT